MRSLRLFDEEGLFIGDGSYLFVPDNEHYEGSDLLWFNEHNHPVDPEKVDLRDKRYQQHRCYKLVSLIYINRQLDFFFTVAARVVPGRRHECPIHDPSLRLMRITFSLLRLRSAKTRCRCSRGRPAGATRK